MIKFIAHRGLVSGPDKEKENSPEQILYSLSLGYDCEIDLWVKNSEFYLGHDYAQYKINKSFLEKNGLWIHAKNIDALYWLNTTNLIYFWHQEDDFTLTSNGFIWTYPNKHLTDKSIQVMPELVHSTLENISFDCAGVCSDFIIEIKKTYDSLV